MSTTATVPAHGAAGAKTASSSAHGAAARAGASSQGADAFAALLQALGAAEGGDPAAAMALPADLADGVAGDEQAATPAGADGAALTAAPASGAPMAVPMQPGDLPAAMLAWAGGTHAARGDPAGKAGQDAAADGADGPAAIGTGGASGKQGPRGAKGEADRPDATDAAPRAAAAAPAAFKVDAAATKPATTLESTGSAGRSAHELAPAMLAGAHAPHVPDAPQAAPTTPVHQAALPSHPLDAAFAGDLAAEVQVMAGAGLQRAELQLHPADLGPVRIELAITAQTADLQLHAAHATTREGLENALPQLREALAASGLQLGQASVGSGAQPQADPGAWREQQARAQEARTTQGGGSGAGSAAMGSVPGSAAVRRNRGLLDLYA